MYFTMTEAAVVAEPEFDMEIVASLTEMGFPVEACKKAAVLTHGRGLESATQWLVEHLDDPDILTPLAPTNSSGISSTLFFIIFYRLVQQTNQPINNYNNNNNNNNNNHNNIIL